MSKMRAVAAQVKGKGGEKKMNGDVAADVKTVEQETKKVSGNIKK